MSCWLLGIIAVCGIGSSSGCRNNATTAYQSANGLVNLVNPTFAVVMGGLAIGRVGYDRWLRFTAPLTAIMPPLGSTWASMNTALRSPRTDT